MSTIAILTSQESGANSLTDINNNFSNLNADKVEGTGAGTDQLLAVFNSSNKAIKGATGTGFVKTTSGIISNVSTIVETDLALTDVGTANSSSTKHGFAPKSPANSTQFLNGATAPAYAAVKDSDLSLTDITTNDASTGRHGFVPKLGTATDKFFRNDGTFAAPTILGSSILTRIKSDTFVTGGATAYYLNLFGSETTGTSEVAPFVVPFSGTISALYVRSGATMGTDIFTVYKNGVATTLTVTFASQTNTVISDTTHSVSVTAGDTLSIVRVSNSGTNNTIANAFSFKISGT